MTAHTAADHSSGRMELNSLDNVLEVDHREVCSWTLRRTVVNMTFHIPQTLNIFSTTQQQYHGRPPPIPRSKETSLEQRQKDSSKERAEREEPKREREQEARDLQRAQEESTREHHERVVREQQERQQQQQQQRERAERESSEIVSERQEIGTATAASGGRTSAAHCQ